MGLCLGMGDGFGERQSRRIGFPELTYGECEWCDSRVFEVPLPPKQLQELSKYFLHACLFHKTLIYKVTITRC
jgi:hypothetical protein